MLLALESFCGESGLDGQLMILLDYYSADSSAHCAIVRPETNRFHELTGDACL